MKTGKCPKCHSDNIYQNINGIGAMEAHYIRDEYASHRADFDCYVCTDCGYTEKYIRSKEDLNKIKNSKVWLKISGANKTEDT